MSSATGGAVRDAGRCECGDVAEEQGDFHGTPVVEAARLYAAASGGQILISDVVRVLAGSRSICPLSSAGALELKGLDVPLLAWQVQWEQWQLPVRGVGGAAAACRDRRTGSVCWARPATRSTAHRVEERCDEWRTPAGVGCGRAWDR